MSSQFKFIHCADLHLDTPFKNIAFDDRGLSARMVESSFTALDTIIDTAIKEDVDFIIFSGDIFDVEFCTPGSRNRFAKALERSGRRCYIAYGNHDHRRKWEDSIPLPANAMVFPETVTNIPFPGPDERMADVIGISHSVRNEPNDITTGISGSDVFSIAVVHCDVDAVSEGKTYAPCRLDSLLGKGIDYWALGHIHKRNVIHEYPHIVYPGNTQGRSPKETGEKGAYLVTVTDGRISEMRFFRTGPILWQEVGADITGKRTVADITEHIAKNTEKGSMIRLRITGRGELDRFIRLERSAFITSVEASTGSKVESLTISSIPDIDIEERRNTGDFPAVVIIESEKIMGMSRNELLDIICSSKASKTIRHVFEGMDDDGLRSIVDDARMSLLERLTGGTQ